jgi:hypothetical protein
VREGRGKVSIEGGREEKEEKTNLNEDVEAPRASEEVGAGEVELDLLHQVSDNDARRPTHSDLAVNQDLSTLKPRFFDESERLIDARTDRVDPVVGDVLHVEHRDVPEAFFKPERVFGHAGGGSVGGGGAEGGGERGEAVRGARRVESGLAEGDDVGDAEFLEHEGVRGMVEVSKVLRENELVSIRCRRRRAEGRRTRKGKILLGK